MIRRIRLGVCILAAVWLTGCVSVGGVADSLANAVLNQADPLTVRDGMPAYLILIDGLIADAPQDADLLLAGARLYGAYTSAFVVDPARSKQMSAKALEYARRAVCVQLEHVCVAMLQPADQYARVLGQLDDSDAVPFLYGLASAWAGWIQAHSGDWQAVSELPKVQATVEKVLALDENYDQGSAHLYMGVLLTLRPAALGGQPEQGRKHFERAVVLSDGRNLMAKVLCAKHYARLVFDRELHDQLLQEVLAAPVAAPGLTLINTLAQQQARELLATSAEYF
jgi:hypothetical protein